MMTSTCYTCGMKRLQIVIRIKARIQRFLRRMLGVPSQEEMQQLSTDLERKLNARVAVFSDMAESRIKAKSKELERAEAEIQRLAGDMTLALYDAVEKIMAEIAEAKRAVEGERQTDDK